MAKKQKKKKGKQIRKAALASGFGAKHLIPELRKAEALMDRGQWQDALLVLTDLNRTNPNQSRVLDHLLSVYYELEYFVPYQSTCEQFLALEPNNANINYVLAGVYVTNNYPLLALNTFQCCLERWPEHEQAETARDLIADLEQVRDSQLNDLKLTGPEGFGLAVLHEQAKAYLEEGEYDKSRQVEETLLQKRPNFLPAYNNLSLAAFLKGDTEGAITLCHQVLERDADNVHALSNLVRYQCAFGQYNAAVASAKRLKASQADAAEGWTKRAEALISVGDDAGILELYEQAQQTIIGMKQQQAPCFSILWQSLWPEQVKFKRPAKNGNGYSNSNLTLAWPVTILMILNNLWNYSRGLGPLTYPIGLPKQCLKISLRSFQMTMWRPMRKSKLPS